MCVGSAGNDFEYLVHKELYLIPMQAEKDISNEVKFWIIRYQIEI